MGSIGSINRFTRIFFWNRRIDSLFWNRADSRFFCFYCIFRVFFSYTNSKTSNWSSKLVLCLIEPRARQLRLAILSGTVGIGLTCVQKFKSLLGLLFLLGLLGLLFLLGLLGLLARIYYIILYLASRSADCDSMHLILACRTWSVIHRHTPGLLRGDKQAWGDITLDGCESGESGDVRGDKQG